MRLVALKLQLAPALSAPQALDMASSATGDPPPAALDLDALIQVCDTCKKPLITVLLLADTPNRACPHANAVESVVVAATRYCPNAGMSCLVSIHSLAPRPRLRYPS